MNNIFFDIKYLIISYIFKKETMDYLITNNYNFKPNLHQKTVKAFYEQKYYIFEDLILNGLFDKNINWFYKDNFIIKLIESNFVSENLVYFYIDNYTIDFNRIKNINYLMTALDQNKFKIADFIIDYHSDYKIINEIDSETNCNVLIKTLTKSKDDIAFKILNHELFDTNVILSNNLILTYLSTTYLSIIYLNKFGLKKSLIKFLELMPYDKFIINDETETFYLKACKIFDNDKISDVISHIINKVYSNKEIPFYKLSNIFSYLNFNSKFDKIKEEIVFNIIIPKKLKKINTFHLNKMFSYYSLNNKLIHEITESYIKLSEKRKLSPYFIYGILKILVKYELDSDLYKKLFNLNNIDIMDNFKKSLFIKILILFSKSNILQSYSNIIFNKINDETKNILFNWIIYFGLKISIENFNNNFLNLIDKFDISTISNSDNNIFQKNFNLIIKWLNYLPKDKRNSDLENVLNIIQSVDNISINRIIYFQENFNNIILKLVYLLSEDDLIKFFNNISHEIKNVNYSSNVIEIIIKKRYFKFINLLKPIINLEDNYEIYLSVFYNLIKNEQDFYLFELDTVSIIDLGKPTKLIYNIFYFAINYEREDLCYEILTRCHIYKPFSIDINFEILPDYNTIFMLMIKYSMNKLVNWILDFYPIYKLNIFHVNKNGDSTLILALKTKQYDIVNKIIEKTDDSILIYIKNFNQINLISNYFFSNSSELYWCCKFPNEKIGLLLVDRKLSNLNYIDSDGNTPLILSCKHFMKKLAIKLIKTNLCDINHINNLGKSALDYCKQNKLYTISELL